MAALRSAQSLGETLSPGASLAPRLAAGSSWPPSPALSLRGLFWYSVAASRPDALPTMSWIVKPRSVQKCRFVFPEQKKNQFCI